MSSSLLHSLPFHLEQPCRAGQPSHLEIGGADEVACQLLVPDATVRGDSVWQGGKDTDAHEIGRGKTSRMKNGKKVVEGLRHLRLKPFRHQAIGPDTNLTRYNQPARERAVNKALSEV